MVTYSQRYKNMFIPIAPFGTTSRLTFGVGLLLSLFVSPACFTRVHSEDPPAIPRGGVQRSIVQGQATTYRTKWAIIVGINKYAKNSKLESLRTAVNDAKEFRDLLVREFGYEDRHIAYLSDEDATLLRLRTILETRSWMNPSGGKGAWSAKDCQPEDSLIVFFAGHGRVIGPTSEGFLAASDTIGTDVDANYIGLTWLRDQIASWPCRHKLIILDSCFSGTLFQTQGNSIQKENAVRAEPVGSSLRSVNILDSYLAESAYFGISAARNTQASDGDADLGHSPFTAVLLQTMRERADSVRTDQAFTFRELASRVESRTRDSFGARQVPNWSRLGGGNGDFVFFPIIHRVTPSEESQRRRYSAAMTAAQSALTRGDIDHARGLLIEQRPELAQLDLRGFEWFHMWRMLNRDKLTVSGDGNAAWRVDFLDSGKTLAIWDQSNTLRRFDSITGRIQKTIETSTGAVTLIDVDPNGRFWVTADSNAVLKLWEMDTGRLLARYDAHPDLNHYTTIHQLSVSRDGKDITWHMQVSPPFAQSYFVTESWAWNTEQKPVRKFGWSPAKGRVVCLLRSGDILTINEQGCSRWSLDGKTLRTVYQGPQSGVLSIAISHDQRNLVAKTVDEAVWKWDLSSQNNPVMGQQLGKLAESRPIAVSEKTIALVTQDRTIHAWDAATGKEKWVSRGHNALIGPAQFNPEGLGLATGDASGEVKLWDAAELKEVTRVFQAVPDSGIVSSPNQCQTLLDNKGDRLVAFYRKGQTLSFALWDISRSQACELMQGSLPNAGFLLPTPLLSPDGNWLVVASSTGPNVSGTQASHIRVWNARTGIELPPLPESKNLIVTMAFSPDSTRFTTAYVNGVIQVWQMPNWNVSQQLNGELPVNALTFSADNNLLAVSSGKSMFPQYSWLDYPQRFDRAVWNRIDLWDITKRQQFTLTTLGSQIGSVVFSSDGSTLATVPSMRYITDSNPPPITVWDVSSKRKRASLNTEDNSYLVGGSRMSGARWNGCLFSPDSRRFAAFANPSTIKVYENSTTPELTSTRIFDHTSTRNVPFFATPMSLSSTAFFPHSGANLIVGNFDTIHFLDQATLMDAGTISLASPIDSLAISGNGCVLATSMQGKIMLHFASKDAEVRDLVEDARKALNSTDHEVCRHGAEVLGSVKHKSPVTIQALMAALKNPVAAVRVAACNALINHGVMNAEISHIAAKLLTHEDRGIALKASVILGRIGPAAESAYPQLMAAIQSGSAPVSLGAVIASQQINSIDGHSVALFLRRLQDVTEVDTEFRKASVNFIYNVVEVSRYEPVSRLEVISELANGIRHRLNPAHVEICINKLVMLGSDARNTVPVLLDAIDDPLHRDALAHALIAIDPHNTKVHQKLVPVLLEWINSAGPPPQKSPDGTTPFRPQDGKLFQAVNALVTIGPPAITAVPSLQKLVNSKDPRVLGIAEYALRLIRRGNTEEVEVLIAMLEEPMPLVHPTEILRRLVQLGPQATKAIPALERLEHGPNMDLADKATEVIRRIRTNVPAQR